MQVLEPTIAHDPELHPRHVKLLVAPVVVEYFPALQLMQTDEETAPIDVEYCPAEHEAHVPDPAVAYVPA